MIFQDDCWDFNVIIVYCYTARFIKTVSAAINKKCASCAAEGNAIN